MDFAFSIDFDADEIYVLVDNTITVTAIRDTDRIIYKNIDKLEDCLHEPIKQIAKILFNIKEI